MTGSKLLPKCTTVYLVVPFSPSSLRSEISSDLDHEHIVRYHDRYVDRDAGILYILMEYCGGGDLSRIIKQAQKHNRAVPEDTIWNYFMQILLALQHFHHPPNIGSDLDGKERRPQILHRDLKPDNGACPVASCDLAHTSSLAFLDDNNSVKLGDFGLSKALPQASFANTYVGARVIAFPCRLQLNFLVSDTLLHVPGTDARESLRLKIGHLVTRMSHIRTLCPQAPFHEAKTHAELSIFIRCVSFNRASSCLQITY